MRGRGEAKKLGAEKLLGTWLVTLILDGQKWEVMWAGCAGSIVE